MKRKNIIFIMLTALLLVLVACNSGNDNATDNNSSNEGNVGNNTADVEEITVWAWDPKFNIAALEIAKEVYAEENPDLKINVIDNAQDDIVQKLNTTMSSGSTKGLPNLVLIEDYKAPGFLKSYPDMFYDMEDVFDPADFAEYKLSSTSYDGVNYGLPFDTGVTGLFIRTDYLEEAGYTLDDLDNLEWSELIEIGKDIKEKTGHILLTSDPNDIGILRVMMHTAGAWYVEDDGVTPHIEGNEALKEAIELYKEMMDAKILEPHSDWSQFLAGFNSGKVASTPTGNWIVPSIKAEDSQAGQWGIAPIPRLSVEGSVNASNLGGSSFYILNVEGAEQTADFLAKTFASDADMYQRLVSEVGALGTYLPATDGEAYSQGDDFFGGQAITEDFTTWMEDVPEVNYGLHTYAIEDILIVELQNYFNGKDLDEVLQDAQKQAESQLN